MKRSNVDFSDSKRRNIKMRQEQKSFLAKENTEAKYGNHTHSSVPNSNGDDYSSYRQMNTNNGQPNVHYIPWDQRSKYTPSMFFGDPSQPWTPQNTSGWQTDDLNNPYNPRRNKYNAPNQYQAPTSQPKKKHHHFFAYTCLAILIALVAWIGFGVYSGSNQSTQPQNQKPRTIRKTIIEKQPNNQNPNSTQNNQTQNQINDLNQKAEKLQADMQNADINSQTQQKLLNEYQKLNANDQKKIYVLTNTLDHMIPSNALKRKVISSFVD